MKNCLFLALIVIGVCSVEAQVYSSLLVSIVESESGKPIKGVQFMVKQLGYQPVFTGSDGKIFLENVPEGEITYIANKEDYIGSDGSFNITSNTSDNSLQIKLSQKPDKQKNLMLISGEVVNSDNTEVQSAKVELRAGNIKKETVCDGSGNYNIEFNLDELQYDIDEFIIEVSKNDCKTKDKFSIPKNNYIYKELVLDCKTTTSAKSNGGSSTPRKEHTKNIGDWEIKYVKSTLTGNVLELEFRITSKFQDRNVKILDRIVLYDNVGNTYKAITGSVANNQQTLRRRAVKSKLVANVPTKMKFMFENISTEAEEVSLIDLFLFDAGIPNHLVQFRNIPIHR